MWSLDRIHKVGELAAAIAVVATLLFVAYEIQQNSAAQKRMTTRSLAQDWYTTVAALQDPEIACIYHRMWYGKNDLTVREARQIDTFLWRVYKVHEEFHYQFVEGEMDESVWSGFRNMQIGAAANERFRDWWSSYRMSFGDRFRDHMDTTISQTPLQELTNATASDCEDPGRTVN
jgi:hypothetical protein